MDELTNRNCEQRGVPRSDSISILKHTAMLMMARADTLTPYEKTIVMAIIRDWNRHVDGEIDCIERLIRLYTEKQKERAGLHE